MILFVRSVYVAVLGLWRFLIVLPVLVAGVGSMTISLMIGLPLVALMFGGQAVIYTIANAVVMKSFSDPVAAIQNAAVGLGSLLFILSLFMTFAVTAALNFVGLTAIRTSLVQQGEYNAADIFRLVKNAFKYAAVFIMLNIVIGGLIGGVAFMVTVLGWTDIPTTVLDRPETALRVVLESRTAQVSVITYLVVMVLLFAALLVPMAGAAWSSTEKMQPLDMFWGAGSSLLPLLAVILVSAGVAWYFGLIGKIVILLVYVALALFALVTQDNLPPMTWAEIQDMLIAGGVAILLFYWQYVAAALAFLKRRNALEAERIEAAKRPTSEWVDPVQLRRAREGQGSIWS